MSQAELSRMEVVTRVNSGPLTAVEAAALVGLSERQPRRILAAYRRERAAAIAHGNRGRKPANTISEVTRRKVVELATTKYVGFNHQHLSEVFERDGIDVSRSSVRRILVPMGLIMKRSPDRDGLDSSSSATRASRTRPTAV